MDHPASLAPPLQPLPACEESLELLRRGRDGDRPALDALILRYQDRVRRVVSIRMGRQFAGLLDAHDLAQDTWLAALRGLNGFQPHDHASIIQWLTRIAENQVLDAADRVHAQKRDRRREVADVAAFGSSSGAAAAPGPSPSQAASGRELTALYDACVAELPESWREVVLLKEYTLLGWQEICDQLGRANVHATQELYRRAQLRLGEMLKQRLAP